MASEKRDLTKRANILTRIAQHWESIGQERVETVTRKKEEKEWNGAEIQ
jgi:hypothetical protein